MVDENSRSFRSNIAIQGIVVLCLLVIGTLGFSTPRKTPALVGKQDLKPTRSSINKNNTIAYRSTAKRERADSSPNASASLEQRFIPQTYPPLSPDDSEIVDLGHGSFYLTVKPYHYEYLFSPKMLEKPPSLNRQTPELVFAILSTPKNLAARQAIRETWAKDEDFKFFILAGELTAELKREMLQYHDILYLHAPEDYRTGLTRKSMLAIQFYHKRFNADCSKEGGTCYDYLFKCDDDSYVNTTQIRTELSEEDPDMHAPIQYYGEPGSVMYPDRDPTSKNYLSVEEYPARRFPMYAHGMGYAISPSFAKCACDKMSQVRKQPPWEDLAVGALARKCTVHITRSKWNLSEGVWLHSQELRSRGHSFSVLHHVQNASWMALVQNHQPLPI